MKKYIIANAYNDTMLVFYDKVKALQAAAYMTDYTKQEWFLKKAQA